VGAELDCVLDDRCTEHDAVADYFPRRRLMQRVTIAGDRPDCWSTAGRHDDGHRSRARPRPISPRCTPSTSPDEAGGQTYFWDLIAAYDALDATRKAILATMRWRPTSPYKTMKGFQQPQALANDAPDQASVVTHPVGRTHPHRGRKALWVSTFTEGCWASRTPSRPKRCARSCSPTSVRTVSGTPHFWEPHDV
jgi:alpha-ketoglutarate-dependent taurine dioxygenase